MCVVLAVAFGCRLSAIPLAVLYHREITPSVQLMDNIHFLLKNKLPNTEILNHKLQPGYFYCYS